MGDRMAFSLLHERIVEILRDMNIKPTKIQEKSLPVILEGFHALIIAPTGTGKTETAMLPIFHKLLSEKHKPISCLYITPLRALNRDLLERMEFWSEKLGIRFSVRHGDTSQYERSKQLKNPPDVLITTPETLQAILCAPKMKKHLENVKYVIVDEIHELSQDKRGSQLTASLERLVELAGEFQRIGLSATVGDEKEIGAFLFGTRNGKIITDKSSKRIEIEVISPEKGDKKLAERLHISEDTLARIMYIKDCMERYKSVLIFVNTRETAEMLSSRIINLDKETKIGVHHSSLSRDVRIITEKSFKGGETKGLIATSSLELGIDIGRINLVIQYMSPKQVTRLIQRVGRSGHYVGGVSKGKIITTDIEDIFESLAITYLAKKGFLEKPEIFRNPLDVLAYEICGLALDFGRISIEKAYEILRRSYPFMNLQLEDFVSVLQQMAAQRIIWLEQKSFGKRMNTYKYYYENLSMIPDERKYFVVHKGRNIATLDEAFVVNYLRPGVTFIIKGTPWYVIDIDDRDVIVEPSNDILGAIPGWEGELLPVSYEVAQKAAQMKREVIENKKFAEKYGAEQVYEKIYRFMKKQEKYFIPDEKTVALECSGRVLILHHPLGSRGNETLSKIISSFLTSYVGESVRVKSTPYSIIIEFPGKADTKLVVSILKNIVPENVEYILENHIRRTPLFKYRFLQVARRFGLIEKEADFQRINVSRLIDALIDSPIYKETWNEIKHRDLDIERVIEFLESEKNVKIVNKITPYGELVLQKATYEIIVPERPEKKLLGGLKEEIYEKTAKFLCTYCHNLFYIPNKKLPEHITCPKCGSSMIAMINDLDTKLLDKYLNKERLTKEEKKRIKDSLKTADLINVYGKRAVIALSVYGVGYETAKRILQKLHVNEEDLLRELLKAQREFIRTRRFWRI